MNNEHDIDLPADADDLSKHAPVLFSLKGKEDGFVVPANYFADFTERIAYMTAIPQESGLVVPENYFEELPGIIEAKTVIPTESGLTEPQNYFDELTEIIEAKSILPAEPGLKAPENYFEELQSKIESHILLENVLPKNESEIPAGYFDQMEKELHVHIALDNVKQDEGFVVPEDYFNDLSDRILTGIADIDFTRSDNTSSLEDPNVPEGYFEAFPEKVIAHIESENKTTSGGRVIVFAEWKTYWRPVSVAASVALLIALSWIFLNNRDNGKGILQVANYTPVTPARVPEIVPPFADTIAERRNMTREIASEPLKKRERIKPNTASEVIMNDEEIIAQSDLMDETMVMDFVAESEVLEASDDVLNEEMMEYLMNDNTGLEVFDPGNK